MFRYVSSKNVLKLIPSGIVIIIVLISRIKLHWINFHIKVKDTFKYVNCLVNILITHKNREQD